MEPLPTYCRILIWLFVCSPQENITKWKRIAYLIFTIVNIASISSVAITSTLLLIRSKSIDLTDTLYVLFQIVPTLSMVYVILAAFLSRNNFNAIFVDLLGIYQTSKYSHRLTLSPDKWENSVWFHFNQFNLIFFLNVDTAKDSFQFLKQVNIRCESFWLICFKIMLFTIVVPIVLCTVSILIGFYITGDFTTKYLYRCFKLTWVKVNLCKEILNLFPCGFLCYNLKFAMESKYFYWIHFWKWILHVY